MLRGSITALITPMRDGAVDEKAFASFVDWQISEGTHGLVPVGTTGESPTVSHEEHRRIVQLCIEVANGRVPVIAGAGSNSTAEAVSLAQHAEKSGASAVLSVVPTGTRPCVPSAICQSTKLAKAFSSTAPSRMGVMSAVIEPRSICRYSSIGCRSHARPLAHV